MAEAFSGTAAAVSIIDVALRGCIALHGCVFQTITTLLSATRLWIASTQSESIKNQKD